MRDILPDVERWLAEGKSAAIATITRTWGSAPRIAGSKMAVSSAGDMAGSVSGGCVESAVVEEALAVLKTGKPKRLHYGVTDEQAWGVGLACGGQIDLLVEPADRWQQARPGQPSQLALTKRALEAEQPAVRAVVMTGEDFGQSQLFVWNAEGSGELSPGLREAVSAQVESLFSGGISGTSTHLIEGKPVDVFYDVQMPAPTLVIIGGVHIGIELAKQARLLGYRVIVVDPRSAFGRSERFPMADRVMNEWPDRALAAIGLTPSMAVAALSHDPKVDDPGLIAALRSAAFYVGALGSAETNRQRRERLMEAGVSLEELARLHAPIGLPLGGRAPEEIALSIMAEIVAARSGASIASRPIRT